MRCPTVLQLACCPRGRSEADDLPAGRLRRRRGRFRACGSCRCRLCRRAPRRAPRPRSSGADGVGLVVPQRGRGDRRLDGGRVEHADGLFAAAGESVEEPSLDVEQRPGRVQDGSIVGHRPPGAWSCVRSFQWSPIATTAGGAERTIDGRLDIGGRGRRVSCGDRLGEVEPSERARLLRDVLDQQPIEPLVERHRLVLGTLGRPPRHTVSRMTKCPPWSASRDPRAAARRRPRPSPVPRLATATPLRVRGCRRDPACSCGCRAAPRSRPAGRTCRPAPATRRSARGDGRTPAAPSMGTPAISAESLCIIHWVPRRKPV